MKPSSVLWATLLFACSDAPSAPGDARGTFLATLSNALTERVTGPARYSVFPYTASSEFRVEFGDTGSARGFSLTIAGSGGRPAVGTFDIVSGPGKSPQSPTAFASACADKSQQQCFTIWHAAFSNGRVGQIEIVKSTQGSLSGRLDVDLFGDGPVSGQVLHVSAKFSATCTGQFSC